MSHSAMSPPQRQNDSCRMAPPCDMTAPPWGKTSHITTSPSWRYNISQCDFSSLWQNISKHGKIAPPGQHVSWCNVSPTWHNVSWQHKMSICNVTSPPTTSTTYVSPWNISHCCLPPWCPPYYWLLLFESSRIELAHVWWAMELK